MSSKDNFDFVGLGFCSNDYLSLLPEIPIDHKVQMLDHTIQGGGPAADAAVAAARLGLSAAFITSLGDDADGRRMISDFELENVSTKGIAIHKNETSPIAYCWIEAPTGKRSVAWTRGTLKELSASEVDMELVVNAKILHIDGHNPKAALAAAEEARKHGVTVCFDAGTPRDGVEPLLKNTDILIASEYFARTWSGEKDLEKALLKLVKIGAKVTGVTMGEHGSMAFDDGKIIRCPAFRIKPVDTTGAGDSFHAGFEIRYMGTRNIYESMRFGSAVSALKCLKLGARAGLPARRQVDEFLAKNQ